MSFANTELLKLGSRYMKCMVFRCFILVILVLVFTTVIYPFTGSNWLPWRTSKWIAMSKASNLQHAVRRDKFLEVPQIIWGLNNQKIALARACLTARFLNRTLLMPSLSASLFYKEVELLKPVAFDKIYQFDTFNRLCDGFVQLGRYSDLLNHSMPFEIQKGSGRKWTKERDLDQLKQCREESIDNSEVIRIGGKNPFLWHDHWSVKDYAKIFQCLVVVDKIENEVAKVISKIREAGSKVRYKINASQNEESADSSLGQHVPYVAVHMRIEKDWMIHCKKLEQKLRIEQICSSKEEIMERVSQITSLQQPVVVYLAVADTLLEDDSILSGWNDGLLPLEKKRLGVWGIYKKYPYLIQSAIDYEVCSRADVFVGNSFSTFSSLVVLSRTQKLIRMGFTSSCSAEVGYSSYAYNILGESGGAKRWTTDMSAPDLVGISYGTNNISCYSNWNTSL
ncbi:hypothetical protein MUK42_26684 [Musa troglodytarum]|uniref:O-fucosyltransferase family protein n=1 Tax=Musa troglodytarum TaxID=320322 RepID=A0A9E7JNI0_9LILI|nr:hypothetical protein MUK42_26684 [Musa troglodytarum]URD87580.1 hypothetical protein MUK42_26684 [Musa troglodytarum]URD87583.1 hypothetical protein MUK42_26684 [Musa troglodytarum]